MAHKNRMQEMLGNALKRCQRVNGKGQTQYSTDTQTVYRMARQIYYMMDIGIDNGLFIDDMQFAIKIRANLIVVSWRQRKERGYVFHTQRQYGGLYIWRES